jgi:magnesium transporter
LELKPFVRAKRTPEYLRKPVFCVACYPTGEIVKVHADDPRELLEIVSHAEMVWINCSVKSLRKDAIKVLETLGFYPTLIPALLEDRYSSYEDLETQLGLMFPAIQVKKLTVKALPLIILIRKGLILTIHTERVTRVQKFIHYADTFMRKIPQNAPWNDKQSIILNRIIDENNEANFEGLRAIEEESSEIGERLGNPSVEISKVVPEILRVRKAITTYLSILWATLEVINTLRYGDAEMITDDERLLERFEIRATEVNRSIRLGENLAEALAASLAVMQGVYNTQLQALSNRLALIITWLTILGTAVMVPNTLATIYGMQGVNLPMSHMILTLVASTVGATWLAYWFIKKKGWLPKKIV